MYRDLKPSNLSIWGNNAWNLEPIQVVPTRCAKSPLWRYQDFCLGNLWSPCASLRESWSFILLSIDRSSDLPIYAFIFLILPFCVQASIRTEYLMHIHIYIYLYIRIAIHWSIRLLWQLLDRHIYVASIVFHSLLSSSGKVALHLNTYGDCFVHLREVSLQIFHPSCILPMKHRCGYYVVTSGCLRVPGDALEIFHLDLGIYIYIECFMLL